MSIELYRCIRRLRPYYTAIGRDILPPDLLAQVLRLGPNRP